MSSILNDIKKLIGGLDEENSHFDADLMIHINSAISLLDQLGFCLKENFVVTSSENTWDEYFNSVSIYGSSDGVNQRMQELVKDYIYLKTRIVFDPPTSSFVLESIKEMLKEYEWRFTVMAEDKR